MVNFEAQSLIEKAGYCTWWWIIAKNEGTAIKRTLLKAEVARPYV